MSKTPNQTIYITQGCDYFTNLQLLNDDSTVINISGYVFNGVLRENPWSNNSVATMNITIGDFANGYAQVTIPANVTQNITYGTYNYNIIANNGIVTFPVIGGECIVIPNSLIQQPLLPNASNQVFSDTFYALANQNSFYLSYTPANVANVTVTYNGNVEPHLNTVYTIQGNILLFANVASQGDVIVATETILIGT